MEQIILDVETAMRAYNWFHHAFPDYKHNDLCNKEDIALRNKLEGFLVDSGL